MSESIINNYQNRCVQTLDQHLEAENQHDLEAILETYGNAPQVHVNGDAFVGIEKVRFFHDRFGFGGKGSFSQIQVHEKNRYITESVIIIEQELTAVHTSTWQDYEPTGKRFTIPVCTVYSFDADGKLAREDVYFDSYRLRKQLGLIDFSDSNIYPSQS